MGNVRGAWLGLCVGASLLALSGAATAQQKLQTVHYGFASKAISPTIINIVLPEVLGFYREDGLTIEAIPLGSNGTVIASLDANRIEFAIGVASYQLGLVAKGEKLNMLNVMEFAYPFKYGMAVSPDSPIKTFQDLKGKRIGVGGFGSSEYPVGQAEMRLIGLDPDKDVSWLAVGEDITAGEALRRHDIDALSYFDTGFGAIEAVGIPMRYLPVPPGVPKIGGQYIATRPGYLKDHRDIVTAFVRDILKASVFIQANPEAAAYAFIKMFPEAAPKGKSIEEQVRAIMVPISKRAPLFDNYDKSVKDMGFINTAEWGDEISFAGLQGQVKDPTSLYSNEVIADANKFDHEKIKEMARNYELPYKKK